MRNDHERWVDRKKNPQSQHVSFIFPVPSKPNEKEYCSRFWMRTICRAIPVAQTNVTVSRCHVMRSAFYLHEIWCELSSLKRRRKKNRRERDKCKLMRWIAKNKWYDPSKTEKQMQNNHKTENMPQTLKKWIRLQCAMQIRLTFRVVYFTWRTKWIGGHWADIVQHFEMQKQNFHLKRLRGDAKIVPKVRPDIIHFEI